MNTALTRLKRAEHNHGESKTRLYNIWHCMKQRCYNPNADKFYNYGARDITVCKSWLKSFLIFKKWAMANGYNDSLTIDRKNTNGNYTPSNCRWADLITQANNKRNNNVQVINEVSHTVSEWSRISGISMRTILSRLRRGDSGTQLIRPVKEIANITIEAPLKYII